LKKSARLCKTSPTEAVL